MRLIIYPADIVLLTGRSSNTARTMYKNMLKHYDKSKEQGLTVDEFCEFMKLDKTAVQNALNHKDNKNKRR